MANCGPVVSSFSLLLSHVIIVVTDVVVAHDVLSLLLFFNIKAIFF